MRVLVFGDSITQGFYDSQGGWVERLRSSYDMEAAKNPGADNNATLFNLGISGDMITNVIKRFAVETENRRWPDEEFGFIFAATLNDTIFKGDDQASSPEAYAEELDTLFAAAGHYSEKILFVGLTPVDDKLCNPWVYSSGGKCFKNERILEFEESLRKFCIENKLPNVQVFEKFQERQKTENLLADGLHPNDAGHQLISELVKSELDRRLT